MRAPQDGLGAAVTRLRLRAPGGGASLVVARGARGGGRSLRSQGGRLTVGSADAAGGLVVEDGLECVGGEDQL